MKPVLKYRGGKSKEIPQIMRYAPKTYDRYIEPFFGGGAMYFHLERKNSIINDINKPLMTFYIQLRDQYPEIRKQLDEIQLIYDTNQVEYEKLKIASPEERVPNKNEELYYKMREIFNYPDDSYLAGVVYYFINKTAYSGMLRFNKNGEYNVPYGWYKNFNTQIITQAHSELLQGSELFNEDYSKIFEMANEHDFMFLDPPYDCVFNDYGNIEKEHGFTEEDQRRLAQDFRNLSCKTLMVIGKTSLTESLYSDFICDEYGKQYAVNIRNRFKNGGMHLIVKNY